MTYDIHNVALTYITIVQDLYRRLSVNPIHDDHTTTKPLQKLVCITKYSLNLKQMLPKYDVNMLWLEYVVCFISQEKISFN